MSKVCNYNGFIIENDILIDIDPLQITINENGTLIIPQNIKAIGKNAFQRLCCGNKYEDVKEVILPKGLEIIDEYAFENLHELIKIVFPNSLKKINYCAFKNCYSLESVTLNEGLLEIGCGVFQNCDLKSLYIPSTVEKIIGAPAPYNPLDKIVIDKRNKFYSDINCNAIYEKETNILIQGCNNIEIPKETKEISAYAFAGLDKLKEIEIPNSVNVIRKNVFDKCLDIENIILHEGLEYIDDFAFRNCISLKELTLPSTLKYIGYRILHGATIEKLNILCNTDIITVPERIQGDYLKEIYINEINKIDELSDFYKEYKNIIKTFNIDELIKQNKSVKEINEIYKNLKETER